ncbi:hypothetical protein SERLA73DRAFT_80909 [Serpula lacrymans var. lacrymans S7.3]|uniref:Reverse transcriptase Ty1/copia-type domain-containing protein n=1 Tax=Serpula lacrymans var. lacrymans (strain S7.3) TaxID=936435 RepID=F8QKG5_SERL3|nr:hypothetical protein SERLA73DRAFT_80909 [Serpula lacrymans var. lacrymans S7.3]
MLHDSKLPKSFWVDAMQTAAYITARSPASGLHGKTPYEILFKRRTKGKGSFTPRGAKP